MTFAKGQRVRIKNSEYFGTITRASSDENGRNAMVQLEGGMEIQVAEETLDEA